MHFRHLLLFLLLREVAATTIDTFTPPSPVDSRAEQSRVGSKEGAKLEVPSLLFFDLLKGLKATGRGRGGDGGGKNLRARDQAETLGKVATLFFIFLTFRVGNVPVCFSKKKCLVPLLFSSLFLSCPEAGLLKKSRRRRSVLKRILSPPG